MCMEDVRIGRQTHVNTVNVTLTGAIQELVPRNPSRTALIISPPVGAANMILLFGNQPGGTGGIFMRGNLGPLVLNIRDHGEMVVGPIFVQSSVADATGYVETLLDKK